MSKTVNNLAPNTLSHLVSYYLSPLTCYVSAAPNHSLLLAALEPLLLWYLQPGKDCHHLCLPSPSPLPSRFSFRMFLLVLPKSDHIFHFCAPLALHLFFSHPSITLSFSIVVSVYIVETFSHVTTWLPPCYCSLYWPSTSSMSVLLFWLLPKWPPGSASLHHHFATSLAPFCNLVPSQGTKRVHPQMPSSTHLNNDSPLW